jgi:hypothetical protein
MDLSKTEKAELARVCLRVSEELDKMGIGFAPYSLAFYQDAGRLWNESK